MTWKNIASFSCAVQQSQALFRDNSSAGESGGQLAGIELQLVPGGVATELTSRAFAGCACAVGSDLAPWTHASASGWMPRARAVSPTTRLFLTALLLAPLAVLQSVEAQGVSNLPAFRYHSVVLAAADLKYRPHDDVIYPPLRA